MALERLLPLVVHSPNIKASLSGVAADEGEWVGSASWGWIEEDSRGRGLARDAGRRVVRLAAGHIISSRLRWRRRFGTRRRSQALGDGGAVGLLAGNPSYDKFTLANDDKFTHPERDSAGLVCRRRLSGMISPVARRTRGWISSTARSFFAVGGVPRRGFGRGGRRAAPTPPRRRRWEMKE